MRFLTTLMLLGLCGLCVAQDQACATRATAEDRLKVRQLEAIAALNPTRAYSEYTVKVIMYRIRESDGSGALNDSAFAEEINNLNTHFAPHDICFSLMRIENIDNSAYTNPSDWLDDDISDSLKTVIRNAYPEFDDVLNIYVLPPSCWYRGSAYGIPATALIMTSNSDPGTAQKWGTAHIAHEVGHCLGLFHTHADATSDNEVVARLCVIPGEPFNNTNGDWWGCCTGADELCDTPADPNLGEDTDYDTPRVDQNTCLFSDTTATDFFGALYNPDVSNIMSYAPVLCRNDFTASQGIRFETILDTDPDWADNQAGAGMLLDNTTISSGHKNVMGKLYIEVANLNEYIVNGTAQVIHESEGRVVLRAGFQASPSGSTGFYVARSKDLCNNDPAIKYTFE